MSGRLFYRGMDRASLDAAYDIVQAVADFRAVLADFRRRSKRVYARHEWFRDLEYGDGDRQRLDLARGTGAADAPTVIYVHGGGYWQSLSKEDFAFVAEGPLAWGLNVLLAEHTLAPHASMTQMVGEIAALLAFVAERRDALRVAGGPVWLVGHSSGAQLSLLHRAHPLLGHTIAISPLVDLEPISLSWLNENLKLTADEIERFSPVRQIAKGPATTTVAVGLRELPELVRHAHDYTLAAEIAEEPSRYLAFEGRDHFSILEELASPKGLLTRAIALDPTSPPPG